MLTNCDGHEVKAAHDNETLFDMISLKTPKKLLLMRERLGFHGNPHIKFGRNRRDKCDVSPTDEEELLIIRRLHQLVIHGITKTLIKEIMDVSKPVVFLIPLDSAVEASCEDEQK
ncbi:hypothetical protein Tco_1300612 [Tanacetum coccineum]